MYHLQGTQNAGLKPTANDKLSCQRDNFNVINIVHLVGAIKTEYADLQNVQNGQLKKKELTVVLYNSYSCGRKVDDTYIHNNSNNNRVHCSFRNIGCL
jgi:hypothetical protein